MSTTTSVTSSGTISSAGVGSGLDVASIVSKLMAVESQPITTLQSQETSINTQISALGKVKSLLSTLQTSVEAMSTTAKMQALTATVSDTSAASATVTNSAVAGTYALQVSQIATQNKLVSSTFASSSTSLGTSSGSITFDFGTVDSSTSAFTANADRSSATVSLTADQMTPAGIRDAINSADIGVTASLVTDSSGTRLMITNGTTGANQAMRISVSDPDGSNTDSSGLSALAYDPAASSGSGKNMTQLTAAGDASFSLDGIALTSSTNTISNVMDGVTLTLTGKTSSTSTTLKIAEDDDTIKSTVNSFITAYNSLASQLNTLTAYDSSSETAGTLQGDSTTLSIQRQLRATLTTAFGTGSTSRLADIGITIQTDGTLKLDETKFDTKFAADRSAVVGLFTQDSSGTSGKGLAGTLDTLITNFIGTTGSITTRTDSMNQRIKNIDDQITRKQALLDQVQARYEAQFSALDTIISQSESLASYLTQQFSSSSSSSS